MALLVAPPTIAQPREPASSSLVLVLKLVSAQRVRPVTGIVVSADGLVLVPAEFIANPGEIVVLDGGTDILSNGRPASIVEESMSDHLALLKVAGLNRAAVTLSEAGLDSDADLHLAAFPPAQDIARGAQPLWLEVQFTAGNADTDNPVIAETPLPYVTGAILDSCGYLAGLSISSGAQSLETGKQPMVIPGPAIHRSLEAIKIELPSARCVSIPTGLESAAVPTVTGDSETATSTGNEAPAPVIDPGSTPVESAPPMETEPAGNTALEDTAGPDRPAAMTTAERPSLWRSVPWWLVLAALLVFAILTWKLVFLLVSRKKHLEPSSSGADKFRVQPASDEPDTINLQTDSEASIPGPRTGRVDVADIPDMNGLPDGCNGVLIMEGALNADTGFRQTCAVNLEQVDVIIGRGEADIPIEHPAISRSHARLLRMGESMTLSDLGSSNGTYIRGVPCLAGEVMFVEQDDEIFLGDLPVSIRLISREVDQQ